MIGSLREKHVTTCLADNCPTCTELGEAIAAYDGFEQAEAARCTCGEPPGEELDHFTTDCAHTRPRPGGAQ